MLYVKKYRKIPNISPGLIEDCKHFCPGLIFEGAYIRWELIFRGSLELIDDLSMPKIHNSVSNQRD